MTSPRTGIIATVTGVSFTLAGFNEVLTCVSLVLGIAIASISLFRLLKTKNKKTP
jgi:hypothetical protein